MSKMNWEKLEKRLNAVQKRCTARTFNMEEVKIFVKSLQNRRDRIMKNGNKLERKYFQKVVGHEEFTVPYAYKWYAYTTRLSGYITRYGRIKINIRRVKADHVSYGGYVSKFNPVYA